MGSSWSFLIFFCAGASQGGFDIDFVAWNWIRQRPYLDRLKLHLAIGVVGLILFIPFYHRCSYDLSQCGWGSNKNSFGTIVLAILSGFLLGFSSFGLLNTWSTLRGSPQDTAFEGNPLTYSPLDMGGVQAASMSMI
jgi:hypothetical protein